MYQFNELIFSDGLSYSINLNCFTSQDQNISQSQLPNGWDVLWAKYPRYASNFLKCNFCSKKPHCHCARMDVCTLKCPNMAEVAQVKNTATGKGPHISHCPICLRIGNGEYRGILLRKAVSDSIELFSCWSCDRFYRLWKDPTELKLKNEMKCNSVYKSKGKCLNYWNCELFNICFMLCLIEIWVVS